MADNDTEENEEEQDDSAEKLKSAQADAKKWKALARKHERESKANADAADKLAELENQGTPDADKLRKQLAEAEDKARKAVQDALRMKVAMDKGLTSAQARRLVGETEDELADDADELLETFGPPKGKKNDDPDPDDEDENNDSDQENDEADKASSRRPPKEKLRSGLRPNQKVETTDIDKLGAEIYGGGDVHVS